MSAPQIRWVKIADGLQELALNGEGLSECDAGGKPLCIARHGDRLLACAQKCPHAGGYLSEGYVDAAGNIVCPVHRYKFSLETGKNVSGEGYYLKTYPVELRPDGIYVGFKEKNWLGF
jgi:3-phenylpropionate/trans-cinnamate dioxygenase ferredoxin subunit